METRSWGEGGDREEGVDEENDRLVRRGLAQVRQLGRLTALSKWMAVGPSCCCGSCTWACTVSFFRPKPPSLCHVQLARCVDTAVYRLPILRRRSIRPVQQVLGVLCSIYLRSSLALLHVGRLSGPAD